MYTAASPRTRSCLTPYLCKNQMELLLSQPISGTPETAECLAQVCEVADPAKTLNKLHEKDLGALVREAEVEEVLRWAENTLQRPTLTLNYQGSYADEAGQPGSRATKIRPGI